MPISPKNKSTVRNFLFKKNNDLKKGDLVRLAFRSNGDQTDNGCLHLCVSDAYRGRPGQAFINYATISDPEWAKEALKGKVWVVDVKALQGHKATDALTGETYSILTCAVAKTKEM